MFIHAVQSKIFNKYLASRINSNLSLKKPSEGDIVGHLTEKRNIDINNLTIVENETKNRIERNCELGRLAITGPLPVTQTSLLKEILENLKIKLFQQ